MQLNKLDSKHYHTFFWGEAVLLLVFSLSKHFVLLSIWCVKKMFIIVFNAPVMGHGYVNFLARIRVNSFSWLWIWAFHAVRPCFLFCFFIKISFFKIQGQIGWRTGSRRLLLFSTDSGFHYAGDGKVMRFNKQEY